MSVTAHIEELKKKHANLSERVKTQARRPGIDALELSSMKKEKLRLKEEIERLS